MATVNGYEVRVINSMLVADRDRTISGTEGAVVGPQTTYTQTYSTTASTVPNATVASVATTASTQTTPYGYASQAQADAIPVNINALAADVLALKKVIGQIIDDLQALSLAG